MAKVVILGSEFVYYNANTRGKNVGDCVKRSLSLAYHMDYNEVASKLNAIKRAKGASAFNLQHVYFDFIRQNGDEVITLHSGEHVTTEQFADEHPTGTWLLITGPSLDKAERGISNHILAVVDGTIYDSWDSTKEFVVKYAKVTGDHGTIHGDIDVRSLAVEVDEKLQPYKAQMIQKYSDMELRIIDFGTTKRDRYTIEHYYNCSYVINNKDHRNVCKTVIKVNPGVDYAKNLESNYKRAKEKLYGVIYEENREYKASLLQVYPTFYGDKKLLLSMPEEIRPYVKHAEKFWDNWNESDKYELCIHPMPGDPIDFNWYLDAYSIRELQAALKQYLENFERMEF